MKISTKQLALRVNLTEEGKARLLQFLQNVDLSGGVDAVVEKYKDFSNPQCLWSMESLMQIFPESHHSNYFTADTVEVVGQ